MQNNFLLRLLKGLAKPFLGKGIIYKRFPWLIDIYYRLYLLIQSKNEETVVILNGLKLIINPKDLGLGLPLLLHHQYEPEETRIFLNCLNIKNTVVDIGANVGYYTVLAGNKVGVNGKVIAFEPDENNFKLLSKNIRLNKLNNIIVEKKAVADVSKKVSLVYDSYNKGGSHVTNKNHKEARQIECVTIDSYFQNTKIDVLKIDIEGYEINVLKGGEQVLKKLDNIKMLIEYHPKRLKYYGNEPKDLINVILSYGFTIHYLIDETSGSTIKYSDKELDLLMRKVEFCNLYCTKGKD